MSDLEARLRSAIERTTRECPNAPYVPVKAADTTEAADTLRRYREENARLRKVATDRAYMLEAVVPMLGPKGASVWQAWQAKGVQRVHFDWGVNAELTIGEDRAQVILDLEEAMKNSVPIDDVDADLARTALESPQ